MRASAHLILAMLCLGLAPGVTPARAAEPTGVWPAAVSPAADEPASVSPAEHRAIEQVIKGQLDAFRHDAGPAAFGFASPKIQSLFGDPAHFMDMVRQGYPPVYRSRSATFGELVTIDGHLVQRVTVIGPDGTAALALYSMEREPNGTWRIDGCTLTLSNDLAT